MPCVTGMGGYDSHVVMATLTNGIYTSEVITKIPPMEGKPFDFLMIHACMQVCICATFHLESIVFKL